MPISLAVLMAVTVALLAAALCAVLWRAPRQEKATAITTVPEPHAPQATLTIEPFPDGSVLVAQLETDQVLTVQTRSARYALRLIDPVAALFEAIRDGRQKGGAEGKTRFQLFFVGTFVPYRGLCVGAIVPGGTMMYRKVRQGTAEPISFTTRVQRVLLDVPEGARQAS